MVNTNLFTAEYSEVAEEYLALRPQRPLRLIVVACCS